MGPSRLERLTSPLSAGCSTTWAIGPEIFTNQFFIFALMHCYTSQRISVHTPKEKHLTINVNDFRFISLERRWSSRRFSYSYLVTTSPQSPFIPSASAPFTGQLRWFRVQTAFVVWRAVCTRSENVFTASFWYAITSDFNFMRSSCRPQSELRLALRD